MLKDSTNTLTEGDIKNLNLVDIYVRKTRKKKDNSFELPYCKLDEILSDRADYIIWRLFVQKGHTQEEFYRRPPQFSTSAEFLDYQLSKVTNIEDSNQKWTAIALVSRSMLELAHTDTADWIIRVSSQDKTVHLDPNDRLVLGTDDKIPSFKKILKWLKLRVAKQYKKLLPIPENTDLSLNTNHAWTRQQLIPFEQRIILALTELSILASEIKISKEEKTSLPTSESVFQVFNNFLNLFQASHSNWQPGKIFSFNLLHHTCHDWQRAFSPSCYIPADFEFFDEWLRNGLKDLSDIRIQSLFEMIPENYKLNILITSLRHAELICNKILEKGIKNKYKATLSSFRIAIDRVSTLAEKSSNKILFSALCAKYLEVTAKFIQLNNGTLGGEKIAPIISVKKAIALGNGHFVNPIFLENDWSEMTTSNTEELAIVGTPENRRYYQQISNRGTRESDNIELWRDRIVPLPTNTSFDNIKTILDCSYLNHPGRLLTKVIHAFRLAKKGDSQAILKRTTLLMYCDDIFWLAIDNRHVGCLAQLAIELRSEGKLSQSVYATGTGIILFARRLLDLLEHPYLADLRIRGSWQDILRHSYLSLSKSAREQMSLEDHLLVFSTTNFVGSTTVQTLALKNQILAEELEQTIYWNDSNKLPNDVYLLRTQADIRLDTSELQIALSRYDRSRLGKTSLVFLMLSNCKTFIEILSVGLNNNILSFSLSSRSFPPEKLNWIEDIMEEIPFYQYFYKKDGNLAHPLDTPVGQTIVQDLWAHIATESINLLEQNPNHYLLIPDPRLATMPWQLVAYFASQSNAKSMPLVSLAPGPKWIIATAHESDMKQFHARGIGIWEPPTPFPSEINDVRDEIKQYLEITDSAGISLAVVFGHGIADDGQLPKVDHIKPVDWQTIRKARICVLLSCLTAQGEMGELGDFVSLTTLLLRHSKALLAPPVKVPHTGLLKLAMAIGDGLRESKSNRNYFIADVYRNAIIEDPANALFSLWGLAYEPLVWSSLR